MMKNMQKRQSSTTLSCFMLRGLERGLLQVLPVWGGRADCASFGLDSGWIAWLYALGDAEQCRPIASVSARVIVEEEIRVWRLAAGRAIQLQLAISTTQLSGSRIPLTPSASHPNHDND